MPKGTKWKEHIDFIAEWIKDAKTPEEAKTILTSKTNAYGEQTFSFDDDSIDDVLLLGGAGDNCVFKQLFEKIKGNSFIKNNPDRDIFYPMDYEHEHMRGHLALDKLREYHRTHNEPYLIIFDILTVYEEQIGDEESSILPFYIIDFDKRYIYKLVYKQEHEGDDQEISFDGPGRSF